MKFRNFEGDENKTADKTADKQDETDKTIKKTVDKATDKTINKTLEPKIVLLHKISFQKIKQGRRDGNILQSLSL